MSFLKSLKEFHADLVSSVLKMDKYSGVCIGLGEAKYELCKLTFFRFLNAGRHPVLNSYSDWKWRRINSSIKIYPSLEPNPHMIIVGMSGFGKSSLCKSILVDMYKSKKHAIVFDAHNEHESAVRHINGKVFDARTAGINILELDGMSISDRISEITRLLSRIYSLGEIQTIKLSRCLWYTYRKFGAKSKMATSLEEVPKLRDLINELSIFIKNAKSTYEKNTLTHMQYKLQGLNISALSGNDLKVEDVLKSTCSFSLAGLGSGEVQLVYINELLKRLYARMKTNEKETGFNYYVMIDEAQTMINNEQVGSDMIRGFAEEGRKYGVGVIIATQLASNLDQQMVANAATFISFYAREPKEINYVANIIGGADAGAAGKIKDRLKQLDKNEALVISGLNRKPLMVTTPKYNDIGFCAADAIPENMEAKQIIKVLIDRPMLYTDFIKTIDLEKYGSQFEDLIDSRQVDTFTFDSGGKKELWVGPGRMNPGIEHRICTAKIVGHLAENNIRAWENSSGPSPDITATVNGKNIAIEYETGKKFIADTRKMLSRRIDAFDSVVVVVNPRSYDEYKDKLKDLNIVLVSMRNFHMLPELLADIARPNAS